MEARRAGWQDRPWRGGRQQKGPSLGVVVPISTPGTVTRPTQSSPWAPSSFLLQHLLHAKLWTSWPHSQLSQAAARLHEEVPGTATPCPHPFLPAGKSQAEDTHNALT